MNIFNETEGFGIELITKKYKHRIGLLKFRYWYFISWIKREDTICGTFEIRLLFLAYANRPHI